MADFNIYIPRLKKYEGGYSNRKNDKGGPTMKGITLTTFRKFYGQDKTIKDLKNITEAQWYRISRSYWDECKADKILNQSIAELVVDWNFNSGTAGRKGTQKAIGTDIDGIFGPKTLAALNADPQRCVFCKIKEARTAYYKELAKTPGQEENLDGWLNRLKHFEYED